MKAGRNAAVMELLARAVTNPAVLSSKKNIRSVEGLDRARVLRFAGFIAKVQHNFLWEHLPLTVMALRRRGLELDLFTAFFASARTPRMLGLQSGPEKLYNAARFIELFARRHRIAELVALVRYELCLWEVRRLVRGRASVDSTRAFIAPTDLGALGVTGPVRVEGFDRVSLLGAPSGAAGTMSPRSRAWLLFCATPDGRDVRVVEIDPGTAVLMGYLAADRPPANLFRAMKRCGVSQAATLARLKRLQDVGVLTLGKVPHARRIRRQPALGAKRLPVGGRPAATSRPHFAVLGRRSSRA